MVAQLQILVQGVTFVHNLYQDIIVLKDDLEDLWSNY
jgi:hypothetical protein